MDDGDPHDAIVRIEAQIEALTAQIESCYKFILAGRIAIAAGAIVFAAMLFGVLRFDATIMMASVAAMLLGIVVWGSNGSTAKQAANELTKAEANRAALIGLIDLRVIAERPTLH
jgi:hypoxanthine-guanine phosphoribosyltransferase